MSLWPGARLPNLTGKNVIVTGANSGIGYYTALELAKAGADVVLACRSAAKGEAAAAKVNAEAPGRALFMKLDLSDFASVREFAAAYKEKFQQLDILINNAGVMALPTRQVTAQGFEQQFGVNIIRRSVEEPLRQIAQNGGMEGSVVDATAGSYGIEPKAGFTASPSGTQTWQLNPDVHFEGVTQMTGVSNTTTTIAPDFAEVTRSKNSR